MSPEQRERLAEELLELRFGCHPDPEGLATRLAADPELQAAAAELEPHLDALSGELKAAAKGPVPREPLPRASVPPLRRSWYRRALPRLAAAALVLLTIGGGMTGWRLLADRDLERFEQDQIRVVVTGPSSVPVGATATFSVVTTNLAEQPVGATGRWKATARGRVLAQGELTEMDADGRQTFSFQAGSDLANPGALPDTIVVAMQGAAREEVRSLSLVSRQTTPLVHLQTDKPVYRPGDTVRLRAVLLDRLTLGAVPGQVIAIMLRDPSGTELTRGAVGNAVSSTKVGGLNLRTDGGAVHPMDFVLPPEAPGGEWQVAVQVAGARGERVFPVMVRRLQVPRFRKEVFLDRDSYRPGDAGVAEVHVSRLGGGALEGAEAVGRVLIDGNEVWRGEAELDGEGRAQFAFALPADASGANARFAVRVRDGANTETAVEPFQLPMGKLVATVHPEGGDLVGGVPNRVYVEVTDSAGRPASASGFVQDGAGERVARFDTVHQGRGRFELTPAVGEDYELVLDDAETTRVDLPDVATTGVALRIDGTANDQRLPIQVHSATDRPLLVAVFCRGVVVGQAVFPAGSGVQQVPVAEEVVGVVRVTVFQQNDDRLVPVAERLVQRRLAQPLTLDVAVANDELAVGATQEITVRAREKGTLVPAVLGVTVYDDGLDDLASDAPVGLLDRAVLLGDVERPQDLEEFFVGSDAAPEHVDLLLGTRGWRRFAWRELPEDLSEDRQRLLVTALPAALPQVTDNLRTFDRSWRDLRVAAFDADQSERRGWSILVALGLLLLLFEGGAALVRRFRLDASILQQVSGGTSAVAAAAAALFVTFIVSFGGLGAAVDGAAANEMEDSRAAPPTESAWGPPKSDAAVLGAEDVDFAGLVHDVRVTVIDINGLGQGTGWFFDDGRDGDVRARTERLFAQDWRIGRVIEPAEDPDPEPFAEPVLSDIEVDEFYRERSVATYRVYAHRNVRRGNARQDFAETLYWNPVMIGSPDANEGGAAVARFRFETSDRLTTWRVRVEGHTAKGGVGQADATFRTIKSIALDPVLPVEVTQGDILQLPVGITSRTDDPVEVLIAARGAISTGASRIRTKVTPTNGRARVLVPLEVGEGDSAQLVLAAVQGADQDRMVRTLRVVPRGFPIQQGFGGSVPGDGTAAFVIPFPEAPVSGSAVLRLYPSPLGLLQSGLQGIVRQPHGCFEQASSSNYPNVMVLSLLERSGNTMPALAARARGHLPLGYRKLTGYECTQQGYEWFGHDPGHLALSAYGLMQFRDMERVWDSVDDDMVLRTRQWILSRRDGSGGFTRRQDGHSFGQAPAEVVDAYVTWGLLHGAEGEERSTLLGLLAVELDARAARAETTGDAYELALCAAALAEAGRDDAAAAARGRLRAMQSSDGSLTGSTRSITSSRGQNLTVETTALAMIAWQGHDDSAEAQRKAEHALVDAQRGGGTFGATQATILALKALTLRAASAGSPSATTATLTVSVNGEAVVERSFLADRASPVEVNLLPYLTAGANEVAIAVQGGRPSLTWNSEVRYHADLPADDASAGLDFVTTLSRSKVEEGETTTLQIRLGNQRDEEQGMVTAVVGIPAGLEVPLAVLEDLQKVGHFDFWERQGRDLHLYWRGMGPRQSAEFSLDLVGRVPGTTTGPASRAWVYYEPERVRWLPGLVVEIDGSR